MIEGSVKTKKIVVDASPDAENLSELNTCGSGAISSDLNPIGEKDLLCFPSFRYIRALKSVNPSLFLLAQ